MVVIIRVLSGTRKSSKTNNRRKEYQNDLEDGGGCHIPPLLGMMYVDWAAGDGKTSSNLERILDI